MSVVQRVKAVVSQIATTSHHPFSPPIVPYSHVVTNIAQVLFGDPFDNQPIQNISPAVVDTFCFALDLICYDTIVADGYHFAYSIDAVPAAQFVASKVSL